MQDTQYFLSFLVKMEKQKTLKNKQSISVKRFDELLEESTRKMGLVYFENYNEKVYKETMFASSFFDRFLNNIIGYDLKRIMKKTGHTLDEILSGYGPNDHSTKTIEEIKEAANADKSVIRFMSKLALKIQKLRQPIFNRLDQILQFKETVSQCSWDYIEGMKAYQENYGKELFSSSAISRAGSNVLAMRLFAEGNDLPCPPNKAMYAIALLHPLTDDYMDRKAVDSTKLVEGIDKKLAGLNVLTDNPYEKIVYDLIDDIFEDYSKENHPVMLHILEELHREQIRSLNQKDSKISAQDIIDISLHKGGLSTLSAAYIALGGLTERQFKFFYELGALFQFIDDSADTQEDINDDVRTIWTSKMLQDQPCDEPFFRVLQLHKYIQHQSVTDYTKDFTYPHFVNTLYNVGFKALMLRGYYVNEEQFSPHVKKMIKDTVPVDYEEMKSTILYLHPRISGELYSSTLEKETGHIPALIY